MSFQETWQTGLGLASRASKTKWKSGEKLMGLGICQVLFIQCMTKFTTNKKKKKKTSKKKKKGEDIAGIRDTKGTFKEAQENT